MDAARALLVGGRATRHVERANLEARAVEWIILIVLVVLLLGALGPRAGWYGAASGVWDIVSLLVGILLIVWILDLLGIINVIG
jgi:hypothetical protein